MNRKALLINDDPIQLEILKKQLSACQLKIREFTQPKEALLSLHENPDVDIIITDLYMPEIDGWKLCRSLRSPAFKELNYTPILVVSATYAGAEAQQISRSIGANHFVSLPSSSQTLCDAVNRLISENTLDYRNSVLIIEDDPVQRKLLEYNFNNNQFQVFTADTLDEGKTLYSQFRPELVICDFHLPDGSAIEFMQQTKSSNEDPFEAIVIVITSDTRPDITVKVLKAGASAFVQKPAKPEYLIELARNLSKERALVRVEDLLENRTRSLKQTTQRYINLTESSPMAIIELNEEGDIVFKNKKFHDLFKDKCCEASCNNWKDVFNNYPFSAIKKRLSKLDENETFRQMVPGQKFESDDQWLYIHAQEFSNYSGKGYVILIEDFTDRLNTISQLERTQSELHKIGNMNSLAELSNNAVFFIKNIISSLKISLDTISNIALEINSDDMKKTIAKANENLDGLPEENQKVGKFIQNFITFVMNQWGALETQNKRAQKSLKHMEDVIEAQQQFYSPSQYTTFYIEDFINDLIQLGGFPFKTNKIEFGYSVNTRDPFTGNRINLAQIVLPMLKNSFEALCNDDENDSREMKLEVCKKDDEWVFRVKDNGPGIPEGWDKKIFYPGFSSKKGAVGSGLSLSFKMAKNAGGDLKYISQPEKGSLFEFSLKEAQPTDLEKEKIMANNMDHTKAI